MIARSIRSSLRRLLGWTAFWIVCGVIHLTQAIWVNGGNHLPGGLGDGRFNNLVLEHGYQSVRGFYEWSSPGQFYPTEDTLGLSDSHVGTLPIYLLPRYLGISVESAMQWWFICIAGLNLIFAVRLMREWRIAPWLCGPVAFGAFAGVPWVWMAGTHAQLLPIFPALWGTIHATHFARSRDSRHLFVAGGALLGQFAAGPYLAFFAALTGSVVIITAAVTRMRPASSPTSNAPSKRTWAFTLLGAGLGLINIWVYAQAVTSGAGRPMQEVMDLAPTWASWLSASPVHFWWTTGWPGGSREFSEQVLFSGLLTFGLSLGALIWGYSNRHQSLGATSLLLSASAWLIILITVRWPNGFSIWVTVAEWIEPLRAFRAIGRIHIITHSLMLLAIGAGLSALLGSTIRHRKTIAWAILSAVILEGVAIRQPAYAIDEARDRRTALVQAWQQNGDRPILAYAPGYTNQPDPHMQLDAWAAALATQRHTLNGYTGGTPLEYLPFIWNPNADQARALRHTLGIPKSQVSIVDQFGPDIAASLDIQYSEQRTLEFLEGFDLQPESWNLFTPLERFRFEDSTYYQFTPPCSVQFQLPEGVTQLQLKTAMRPGAYTDGKNSDGYQFTVRIEDAEGGQLAEFTELINPRDNAQQRGFLSRSFPLPAGGSRLLVIELGSGPANSNAWDWPLLADLKIE